MKQATTPIICGLALTAMSAAGLSHWWSVRQFVAAVDGGLTIPAPRSIQPADTPKAKPEAPREKPAMLLATAPKAASPAAESPHQKEFYEALVSRIENLQNQNRDLLDQVAETNRDLMKLEFRVDTHSEQFRPLPVSEDRPDTSFEDDPGVLPPRAEPVLLPTRE